MESEWKLLQSNKVKKIMSIVFIVMACLLTAIIYMWNFYPQTGVVECWTDTYVHIWAAQEWIRNGQPYSLSWVYPLFFAFVAYLGKFLNNYYLSATIFAGLWSGITCLLQIFFLNHFFGGKLVSAKAVIYGFALSFLWPIDPTGIWHKQGIMAVYLKSGGSAAVHNLTYLAVKPFAICCIFLFCVLFLNKIKKLDDKKENIYILLFALSFLGSVLAKPNFYQCFAPAGALIAVIMWIKYGRKIFPLCVKMAVAFLPATIWVLYAMKAVVGSRIGFSPLEGIKIFNYDFPIWLVILQAAAFMFYVIIECIIRKNFSWVMLTGGLVYCIGLTIFLLFIEPEEKSSLNMIWGYNCGMYIAFFCSIITFEEMWKGKKIKKWEYAIGNTLLAWHFIIGLAAFLTYQVDTWKTILG